MFEHRQVYKASMYEGSVRVPMQIAGPGIKAGRRVKKLASLIDVFPTLLDMARVSNASAYATTSTNAGAHASTNAGAYISADASANASTNASADPSAYHNDDDSNSLGFFRFLVRQRFFCLFELSFFQ